MERSLLQTYCTLFKTYYWKKENKWCFDTRNGIATTFEDILLNPIPEQAELIQKIRSLPYKSEEQSELKQRVWGITPSSVQIGGRGRKYHSLHTRFISFDIDGLGDQVKPTLEAIKNIPFVAYSGRSVSGNGLWGLIRISDPVKHSEHFDAMSVAFKSLGITIDPAPRNVASLRFLCYDPEAYINLGAIPFTKTIEKPAPIKKPVPVGRPFTSGTTKSNSDTDGKDLVEKFNAQCTAEDMHEILTNYGFNYHSRSGKSYRFTRPGKATKAGLSVDFHEDKRTLYSFSSEVPMLEKWKSEGESGWSCSPVTALLLYGCGGMKPQHWAIAFNYIKNKFN